MLSFLQSLTCHSTFLKNGYFRFATLLLVVFVASYLLLRNGAAQWTNPVYAARNVGQLPSELYPIGGKITSDFFFLTNFEQTRFGEFVWYWSRDRILAPNGVIVHSNSDIGVHTGAYFGCLVTTTGRIFSPEGSSFYGVPRPGYFELVRPLTFPQTHDLLRTEANRQHTFYSGMEGTVTYCLELDGTTGYLWRWETGTIPPIWDRNNCFDSIRWHHEPRALFFDAPLWMKGVFRGKLGIGSSCNIRLMDNVRAEDATMASNWLIPTTSQNFLTLVSEAREPELTNRQAPNAGILIGNTIENGMDNGIANNAYPGNQNRRDIVITAQLMALNGSLSIEDQNDAWETRQAPTNPDERGTMFLHGNVVQHRKGYVHRSNGGGTGYDKQITYDNRFMRQPPPYSLMVR